MAAEAIHVNWGWPQMEEILQCPICFELPIGPVPICTQGHHICTLCRQKIENCPLCKAQYKSEARNFAIEELLANISIIKNLMTLANITTAFPNKRKKGSTKSCEKTIIKKINKWPKMPQPVQSKGAYPCLFCEKIFPVNRMLVHIRYYHKNDLLEVPFTQPFQVTVEFKIMPNTNFTTALKAEKLGVFFLTYKAAPKQALLLRMVACHTDAQKYTYSLKIPNETTNYFGRVMSCREPSLQIIKKQNCLIFDSAFIKKLNRIKKADRKITVVVTINRTEDPIPAPPESESPDLIF